MSCTFCDDSGGVCEALDHVVNSPDGNMVEVAGRDVR